MNRIHHLVSNIHRVVQNSFGLVVHTFVFFFLIQLFNIYKLRTENRDLILAINQNVENIRENNKELRSKVFLEAQRKTSAKKNIEKAMPYLQIIESFDASRTDLSEFINQINKDLIRENIYSDERYPFFDPSRLLGFTQKYPVLNNYVLSKMEEEFLLRISSNSSSLCCWFSLKMYTGIKELEGKYHFYPNFIDIPNCSNFAMVNGEVLGGRFIWQPLKIGIHYFDIEYIDTSNFKIKKKKFRMGLKVV